MMLEARTTGADDVASPTGALLQLQDIKEEEDVELTRLNSHSSTDESRGSHVIDEKQRYRGEIVETDKEVTAVVSGAASRDDLSLLPPLPNTIETVVDQDEAAGTLTRDQQDQEPETASQFDLSKALEIPVSAGNTNNDTSTINNTGSHSDSSLSLTPLITSPKLSLKKRFSVTTPEGSPKDGADTRTHVSARNRSNSNVAAFQHILPAFNMAIDGADHHHHHPLYHQPQMSVDKRSVRKFSFGDTSSLCTSDNSFSETELLYKIPPPLLSRQSRSRSGSNPLHGMPIEGLNTPGSSILESDTSPKKVPLLRRASSAILRKTSLRSIASKDIPRSSSASTTPVLPSRSVFDNELPVRTAAARSQFDGSSTIHNSEEDLLYVTPLNGTSEGSYRNPSIRSRVRRGFSRIISSSGSVRRVASSTNNARDVFSGHESDTSGPNRIISLSTTVSNSSHARFEMGRRSFGSSKHSSPTEARRSGSNPLATPVSASTAMTPTSSSHTQHQTEQSDQRSHGVGGGGVVDQFDQLGGQNGYENARLGLLDGLTESTDRKRVNQNETSQDGVDTIENDITVDLDKLTQSIPVITVTDKLSAKDCTAIQLQSNIILDEVYSRKSYKNDKRYIGGTRDKRDDSNKPEMMTLSEYTNVLMRQQQVEDERLAALEKYFKDSGWCSNDDLMNLKQKRVIISKKWAERISFYQNKLDS